MIEKRQFYIDGAWTEALDGRDHEVIDPATEEPCAIIALGGQADTDAAVGYYPVQIEGHLDKAVGVSKPAMLHIAEKDGFCPPEA